MDKIPTFREIMDLARTEGMYSVHKCVLEHVEKTKAKWKKTPGAPLPDHDITADHIIAYNYRGVDDGKYHPDFVHPPEGTGQIGSYIEFDNDGRYVTIPGYYTPVLNLSRRNSGKMRGSNGFIDNQIAHANLDISDEGKEGFTASINPKTHRVFNNVDDWINFVKEHSLPGKYTGRGATKGDWLFPDLKTHADNGVKSIEWNRSFFDDLKGRDNKTLKKLFNARVGMPLAMGGEPQIAVLHPDAILSTKPYNWANVVDKNSKEYRRLKEMYES